MAEATTPGPDPSRGSGAEAYSRTGGPSGPDHDDARLDSWLDELRSDAAVQTRRREQWLRRQAAEDATVAGVLVDYAEHGSVLAVTTRSGNRHVGRVRGAGALLVTLDVTGARVVIEVDEIDTFRALSTGERHALAPTGHRSRTETTTMSEVLAQAADERPEVTLITRSGEVVSGTLMAVGRDVVMLRPPAESALVYLPLASVSEALLPASTGSG